MTSEPTVAGVLPADSMAVGLMSDDDRRALTLRLAGTVAGVSLLCVATLMARLAPDQIQLVEAGKALAALIVGAPVLARGLRALFDPRAPSATEPLVALAVLAAMAGGAFGTAVLIPTVMEIGRLFEERSSLGVLAALEGIRRLRAVTAQRETAAGEDTVSVDAIGVGDVVIVRPGEIFPADGTVLTGTSSLDSAAVTGESRLDDIEPGSTVFAGTRNVGGLIRLKVLASGARSLLGRVVQTLAEVEQARTPFLRVFDGASRDYLPVVLTVAATVLFFTSDLERAIAVLVVACPTALLLSGPAAMVAAMTASSRAGILLKSARFLERIGEVDTLVLDKTGTVTQGIQALRAIVPMDGTDEETVLRSAARCGHGSIHPVSRAIVAAATARGLQVEAPTIVRELPGLGVAAETPEGTLRIGRAAWLQEVAQVQNVPEVQAGTVVWVAHDARLLGRIELYDPPRDDARTAIDEVRDLGISKVILLTGDRASIANEVATELGLDDVEAEVHPDHKLARVHAEQAAGRVVMMVGDGINDALALAGADVGVALGSGGTSGVNEVALGGADIALLRPDLAALPQLMRLADRVRSVMTWNAVLALGGSAASVLLAAAGWLGPVAAAAAQSAGVLAVVLNSGRLLRTLDAPSRETAPTQARTGTSHQVGESDGPHPIE
jgi:heavy metal translocating P-type ATPase